MVTAGSAAAATYSCNGAGANCFNYFNSTVGAPHTVTIGVDQPGNFTYPRQWTLRNPGGGINCYGDYRDVDPARYWTCNLSTPGSYLLTTTQVQKGGFLSFVTH